MDKINFIYRWGGNRSLSWSGTPYGILTALQKKVSVNDISLHNTIFETGYRKAVSLLTKISGRNNFYIIDTKLGERQINRQDIRKGSPCLTFLEYQSDYVEDTYVYQDCSVDYLVRLKEAESPMTPYTSLPTLAGKDVLMHRRQMTKDFYEACRGIFTMSKWLAEDLVINTGLPRDKVHCVGGGCNIDTTGMDDSCRNGHRFLYIGKGWEGKNGPLVIEAFERLEKHYPEIELHVAGPVEEKAHNSTRIHFYGRLSYEDLIKLYNLCDYFVMPSKFEAYGIVFGEALIFGLPCIGKDCCAMPEFITPEENGYLLKDDNVEEFCGLMEKMLLNSKALKDNCTRKHLFYRERYSWGSVADRIINVIRNDGYDI